MCCNILQTDLRYPSSLNLMCLYIACSVHHINRVTDTLWCSGQHQASWQSPRLGSSVPSGAHLPWTPRRWHCTARVPRRRRGSACTSGCPPAWRWAAPVCTSWYSTVSGWLSWHGGGRSRLQLVHCQPMTGATGKDGWREKDGQDGHVATSTTNIVCEKHTT